MGGRFGGGGVRVDVNEDLKFLGKFKNFALIGQAVSEKKIFENGGRTDGRRTDAGSMGIL